MVSVRFDIRGMSCQGCANSVTRRMTATPGVHEVAVDLAGGTAEVSYDDAVTSPEALENVITALGFTVESGAGRRMG